MRSTGVAQATLTSSYTHVRASESRQFIRPKPRPPVRVLVKLNKKSPNTLFLRPLHTYVTLPLLLHAFLSGQQAKLLYRFVNRLTIGSYFFFAPPPFFRFFSFFNTVFFTFSLPLSLSLAMGAVSGCPPRLAVDIRHLRPSTLP
ncbi:hypothetical protein L249_4180, partial [Ophiocordyceps polyrhachis-furcata BCC 54312]